MSDTIDITIRSRYDRAGADAAIKDAQRLRAAAASAAQQPRAGGGDSAAKEAQDAARALEAQSRAAGAAAKSSQALAQAQAATARAQAQAAAAAQRLATEEARTATATAQAAAASARAEQAALRLAAAQSKVGAAATSSASGLQILPRTIAGLSDEAAKFAGSLSAVAGITGIAAGAYELAKMGAGAQAAQQSFDALAQSAGTSGAALLSSLQSAAQGTVANTDLIKSANTALVLLGNDVAQQLPQLLEIAKASATALGGDVGQLFDNLVVGIARGSTELLDNLGISLSATEAYESYAAAIGKSANELSKAERSQAILNAVLAQGDDIMARTGGGAANAAMSFQQLEAGLTNLHTELGQLAAGALAPAIAGLGSLVQAAAQGVSVLNNVGVKQQQVAQQLLAGSTGYADYAAGVQAANNAVAEFRAQDPVAAMLVQLETLPQLNEAQYAYAQALMQVGVSAQDAMEQASSFGVVMASSAEGAGTMVQTSWDIAGAQEVVKAAMADVGAVTSEYTAALQSTGASAAEAAAQAQSMGPALLDIAMASAELSANSEMSDAAVAALRDRMIDLAAAGGPVASAMFAQVDAFNAGQIGAAELEAGLTALEAAHQQQRSAAAEAAVETLRGADASVVAASAAAEAEAAALANADALVTQTQSSLEAAIQSEQLASFQQTLANLGGAVAGGLMTSSAAAAALASQYNITAAAAANLIRMQAQLGQAKAVAAAVTNQRAGERNVGYEASRASSLEKIDAAGLAYQQAQARAAAKKTGKGGGGGGGGGGKAAGGGGGGGGTPKVSEAQKAGDSLAKIEADTGRKLASIDQQTQQKLAEIDARGAEQRIASLRKLGDEMARMSAQTLADQEANDFDLLTVEDEAQAARLQAREAAEINYRARIAQAQQQAQQEAATGDADLAREQLKIRESLAKDIMNLDQQAAEARAKGADEAAVAQVYDEAVKAAENAAQVELDIARAASDEKKAEKEAEKAEVVAKAEEQKNAVVGKAIEQANGVKGASQDTKNAIAADLSAMSGSYGAFADAATAALARVTSAASKAASATASVGAPGGGGGGGGGGEAAGGGGGANQAAGGGTFVTTGPTTLTVGDNPGGAELVQVTPLSGKGQTRAGHNMLQMAGGGMGLAGVRPDWVTDDMVMPGGSTMAQGRESQQGWQGTVEQVNKFLEAVMAMALDSAEGRGWIENYAAMIQAAIDTLMKTIELREKLKGDLAPIKKETLDQLAQETLYAAGAIGDIAQHMDWEFSEGVKYYADATEKGVGALLAATDLRQALSDKDKPAPPLTSADIHVLAAETRAVLDAVRGALAPENEQIAAGLESYQAAVEHSVGTLQAVVTLRQSLKEADVTTPLFTRAMVERLALDTAQVAVILSGTLIERSREQRDALEVYADYTTTSAETIQRVVDLREAVTGLDAARPLLTYQQATALALDVAQAAAILSGTLIERSAEQNDALDRYVISAQRSIEALTSVLALRRTFDDNALAPPLDAERVSALAGDLQQVVRRFQATVLPLSEEVSSATDRYAGVAGAAVDTLSGMLDLRRQLGEAESLAPLDEAQIRSLVEDTRRVAELVGAGLLPVSEEQQQAVERYAQASGSAAQALQGTLGLTADLFADYASPSDAQINQVLRDAERITSAVSAAASVYEGDGLAAGKQYAEAASAAFGAVRGGLEAISALNSGDFTLDAQRLAGFERDSMAVLSMLDRIGAEAAAVPSGAFAAISAGAGALKAQSEALTALAGVPFGDLPSAAGSLGSIGGGGGGGSIVTIMPGAISITQQPGQDARQLADAIIRQIEQRYQGRR